MNYEDIAESTMLGDEVQHRKITQIRYWYGLGLLLTPIQIQCTNSVICSKLNFVSKHRGSSNIIYCIAIIMMLWPMFAKNNVTLAF
jgi:hypothetical protein